MADLSAAQSMTLAALDALAVDRRCSASLCRNSAPRSGRWRSCPPPHPPGECRTDIAVRRARRRRAHCLCVGDEALDHLDAIRPPVSAFGMVKISWVSSRRLERPQQLRSSVRESRILQGHGMKGDQQISSAQLESRARPPTPRDRATSIWLMFRGPGRPPRRRAPVLAQLDHALAIFVRSHEMQVGHLRDRMTHRLVERTFGVSPPWACAIGMRATRGRRRGRENLKSVAQHEQQSPAAVAATLPRTRSDPSPIDFARPTGVSALSSISIFSSMENPSFSISTVSQTKLRRQMHAGCDDLQLEPRVVPRFPP